MQIRVESTEPVLQILKQPVGDYYTVLQTIELTGGEST